MATEQAKQPPQGTLSLPIRDSRPPAQPLPRFEYFLCLPPEIRLMIYDPVMWAPVIEHPGFDGQFMIVCVDPPKKPDLALLRVNRLVGAEAHHRFYNSACFYINEYQLLGDDCESNGLDQFLVPDWLKCLGSNVLSIATIRCWVPCYVNNEPSPLLEGIAGLSPLLPNLRRIELEYGRRPLRNSAERYAWLLRRVQELKEVFKDSEVVLIRTS